MALFKYPSTYGTVDQSDAAQEIKRLVWGLKDRDPRALSAVKTLLTDVFTGTRMGVVLVQDAPNPADRTWHLVHAPRHKPGLVNAVRELGAIYPPQVVQNHCSLSRIEGLDSPSHIVRANYETHMKTIRFDSVHPESHRFIFWDDVYTSGVTSRACKARIREKVPGATILCLFLAKTGGISPDSEYSMSELSHPVREAAMRRRQVESEMSYEETQQVARMRSMLRKFRFDRAMGKAGEIVLDDATMELLIATKPKTLKKVERLTGFGPARMAAWGPSILGIIETCALPNSSKPRKSSN